MQARSNRVASACADAAEEASPEARMPRREITEVPLSPHCDATAFIAGSGRLSVLFRRRQRVPRGSMRVRKYEGFVNSEKPAESTRVVDPAPGPAHMITRSTGSVSAAV